MVIALSRLAVNLGDLEEARRAPPPGPESYRAASLLPFDTASNLLAAVDRFLRKVMR